MNFLGRGSWLRHDLWRQGCKVAYRRTPRKEHIGEASIALALPRFGNSRMQLRLPAQPQEIQHRAGGTAEIRTDCARSCIPIAESSGFELSASQCVGREFIPSPTLCRAHFLKLKMFVRPVSKARHSLNALEERGLAHGSHGVERERESSVSRDCSHCRLSLPLEMPMGSWRTSRLRMRSVRKWRKACFDSHHAIKRQCVSA
ncbi:hypothetical protein J2Z75_005805 [Rhizobium herbae]|uniref:Uncharacterized protein n=1 Tax=Rhizobium herbae TaxID=508661 RepID=A0ABS4EWF3_9HYPH|nr:hypothetical protein [Rhizobium herbae]